MGINLIINSLFSSVKPNLVYISSPEQPSLHDVKKIVSTSSGLPVSEFQLLINGKKVDSDDFHSLCFGEFLTVTPYLCLPGGKGGFGSMLRAIGAQIEKTTNKEACRDLSGRRLRDVNAEKRYKREVAKKALMEVERKKKRKEKLEKMKREPKFNFKDDEYFKVREELPDIIDDALEYGLKHVKASSTDESSTKRKIVTSGRVAAKKRCLWFGVDELEDEEAEVTIVAGKQFETTTTTTVKPSACSGIPPPEEVPESNLEVAPSPEPQSNAVIEPPVECETVMKTEVALMKPDVLPEELDLERIASKQELQDLGIDRLKAALMFLSMKCGGTLEQRADRLWSVRGLKMSEIPKNLRAKK
ncbi:Replication stress response regulator SDE2 [Halotydeus destructor]|nr:Replication stress response regulator SDE2 [Halotydeus destructor]